MRAARIRRTRPAPLALVAIAALLAAPPITAAQPQSEVMVHVNKDQQTGEYAFVPARIEAAPGALIQLMVFGEARHTMTSETGAWPDVEAYGNGVVGTAEFRAPQTPGEYPFVCRFHGSPTSSTTPGEGLRGVLVVVANGTATTPGPAQAPEIRTIERGYDLQFTPARLEAEPGAQVTFRPDGKFAHTLTATDGAFDTGDVRAGASATFRAPSQPGDYAYRCLYHEQMTGTLVVRAASSPATESREETPTPQGLALVGIALAALLTLRSQRRPR